jgi:flavin reductase (DIM6/NTAB) family NADH-FMN oxidoreductase RutF
MLGSVFGIKRRSIILPTILSLCYSTTTTIISQQIHRSCVASAYLTSASSSSSSHLAPTFRTIKPTVGLTKFQKSELHSSSSSNDHNNNNNNNNNNMSAENGETKKMMTKSTSLDTAGFQSYTPDDLSGGARYGLCISSVIPRPVAVITSKSSKNEDGVLNCAPFSYTSISSHDPPIVTHGLCLSGGNKKDTLQNIEATGEWVYNVLTTNYLEDANACATTQKIDEATTNGLETIDSDIVGVPRLRAAAVSMECKLWDKKEVFNDKGEHTTTIVMGRVVKFHIHKDVLKDGREPDAPLVDLRKVQAVGRAGDITYWPAGVAEESVLPMPRPK